MAIIYKATNVINGKVYVGQTWQTLISSTRIKEILCGKRNKSKGWRFSYNKIFKKQEIGHKWGEFFIAEKDGKKLLFNNQPKAAEQLKVTRRNIGKVLHGERKTAGGWRFRYENQLV